MPPLPASIYGFSYMYDRTAAIGLLDAKPQTFGSVPMSLEAISEAGDVGARARLRVRVRLRLRARVRVRAFCPAGKAVCALDAELTLALTPAA